EAPQLGALVLRVPLAELVAVGVDALLGAGLLLVAATASECCGEVVLLDRVQERADLEPVAARLAVVCDDAALDRLIHRRDDHAYAEVINPRVARREHLGEVESRVDLENGERDPRRVERLL